MACSFFYYELAEFTDFYSAIFSHCLHKEVVVVFVVFLAVMLLGHQTNQYNWLHEEV